MHLIIEHRTFNGVCNQTARYRTKSFDLLSKTVMFIEKGQIERVLERRWSCNTISLTLWNLSSNDIYTINFLILKPSRLFDIDHAFRSREPSSWQPPILLKSAFTGMTVGHFWLTTILLEKPLFSFKTLNKIINMAFDKNKLIWLRPYAAYDMHAINWPDWSRGGFMVSNRVQISSDWLFKYTFLVTTDHVSVINYNRNESEWDQ